MLTILESAAILMSATQMLGQQMCASQRSPESFNNTTPRSNEDLFQSKPKVDIFYLYTSLTFQWVSENL